MVVAAYTVVIPAWNAADTIAEALDSVLSQTVPPERVIVVNDGSTDGTAEIVSRIEGPLELVSQDNAGPGAATTRGMAMVRTPYIATLDADDLWLPDKMERQLAALEGTPGIDALFGQMANFKGSRDNALLDQAYDGWSRTTMVIRTSAAQAAGAIIDPAGGAGDMIDWLARLREAGRTLVLEPRIVALRRIRPGSMTYGRKAEISKGYLQVAREAMLRRRAGRG